MDVELLLDSFEGDIHFAGKIFLENSFEPSSHTGANVPIGLLVLTNKYLIFLYLGDGNRILHFRPQIISSIVSSAVGNVIPTDNLSMSSQRGIENLIEKGINKIFGKILETEPNIDLLVDAVFHDKSFIIKLEDIINIRLSDRRFYSFNTKKSFIRFSVIMNYVKEYFCWYAKLPAHTQDEWDIVHYFEIFYLTWRSNIIKCTNCGVRNPLSYACKSCGIELRWDNLPALLVGLIDLNQGYYESAIYCFSELLGYEPKNRNAHFYLGVCYKKLGDYGRAYKCFWEAWNLKKKDYECLYQHALCAYYMQQYRSTIADCIHISEDINKDNPEALKLLVKAYMAVDKLKKAKKKIKKVLKINPNDAEAKSLLEEIEMREQFK